MAKFSDYSNSKSFKAEDFDAGPRQLTISNYREQDFGDGPKPILEFAGEDKSLVCNKTNGDKITLLCGGSDDMDKWIGLQITLGWQWTSFQGKTMRGVRVLMPGEQQPTTPAPAASVPSTPMGPGPVDQHGKPAEDTPF